MFIFIFLIYEEKMVSSLNSCFNSTNSFSIVDSIAVCVTKNLDGKILGSKKELTELWISTGVKTTVF